MQSPNENIFDVLEKMRKSNFQPPYYQACVNDYADRIEKCVCDLVEEAKDAVNQAWQTTLGSITDEFDRRIRENLREKALRMFGKDAHLTEIDRIEAAVKSGEVVLRLSKEAYKGMQDALSEHDRLCEMLSESRESIGNAAAMRGALERIVRYEDGIVGCIEGGHASGVDWDGVTFAMIRTAKEALSEPPRNCDRFVDEQDAQLAFLNEEWLISVDRGSMIDKDKFENWTDQMRSAYARWLMATEKGDADEK